MKTQIVLNGRLCPERGEQKKRTKYNNIETVRVVESGGGGGCCRIGWSKAGV